MENDDDIRTPDPVKTDRLLEDEPFISPIPIPVPIPVPIPNLEDILKQSEEEFNTFQEQEEQKQLEQIFKQMKEEDEKLRLNKFNLMKIQLNKIILLDKTNASYYSQVLSIIEMFENKFINEYIMPVDEYTNIFKLMKTIRVPKEELDNLKKIIISI